MSIPATAVHKLEPEFIQPFSAWRQQQTPETSGALLRAIRPILSSAITSYAPGSGPAVTSRAKLLALNAMARYDPRQTKLRSYLLSQLQSLRRVGREASEPIRVPERITFDAQNLERSRRELEDQLGREPTTLELSDHSGLSPTRISRVRSVRPAIAEGTTQQLVAGSEGGDALPSVVGPLDDDAWTDFVYRDLAPQEQKLLEWSTGLHGTKQLSNQAAADKLGLSPATTSQRRARIQTKLDARQDFLP